MGRASPMYDSLNGGEISSRMQGQPRHVKYANGLKLAENVTVLVQGPAVKDSGTYYVAEAAGPCRLIPFDPFITQGYVIEASAGALRFYTNDAPIMVGPDPYELAAPWTYAQIRDLDWQDDRDVMLFTHGDVQPRLLSRTGAVTFALAEWQTLNGPFDDANIDKGLSVTASATDGTGVTLTASAPIFAAGDVGALFRMEVQDYSAVPAWEAGITVALNDLRWSGLNVYRCVSATANQRTGTIAPTHVTGSEWDGMSSGQDVNAKGPYGVRWEFVHGRFGVARITGFTSTTEVTVTVLKRLPFDSAPYVTWRWAHGAFSDTRGWPAHVAFWNQRVVLSRGNRIFGGVTSGNRDFSTTTEKGEPGQDQAFIATLPDPNEIVGLSVDRGVLVINAVNGEYLAEQDIVHGAGPLPPQIKVKRSTRHGAAPVRPVTVGAHLMFIQRAGRKMLALDWNAARERYDAPDATRYADHLGASGLVELAWQQEPVSLIHAVMGDGSIARCTWSPDEEVMGWTRRRLANGRLLARSVCTIPEPSGAADQLWIAAEFGSRWLVLRAAPLWQSGDDQMDGFFVDAGLGGLSGGDGPATVFDGLGHLAGETVAILADGAPRPPVMVADDGSVTLDYPARRIAAGLPYAARIRTLPIEPGSEDGTAQGKPKRIPEVILRLLDSGGVTVTVQDGEPYSHEFRDASDAMDKAVPLFTGDVPLQMIGAHDARGEIEIASDDPTPLTVLAIMPVVLTGRG